jgi:hypothetical protein
MLRRLAVSICMVLAVAFSYAAAPAAAAQISSVSSLHHHINRTDLLIPQAGLHTPPGSDEIHET